MSTIAADAERWVKEAAGKANGLSIGAQILQACANLGYPRGHWRVRAAWNGEADCWSAKAFEDLRARYRAWDARQAALAAEQDKTHAALLRAGATALESTHAAADRQDARAMRDHAERLVPTRPRHRAG